MRENVLDERSTCRCAVPTERLPGASPRTPDPARSCSARTERCQSAATRRGRAPGLCAASRCSDILLNGASATVKIPAPEVSRPALAVATPSADASAASPRAPAARVRARRYTARMPIDVDARVIANDRLTADYNVIALEAPAIAAQAAPGQFVMVRPQRGLDPLLRRPFSVFEILRDRDARTIGLSLLNKRIGHGTGLLFDAEPGDRVQCLGPLGRPFVACQPANRGVDGSRWRRPRTVCDARGRAARPRSGLNIVLWRTLRPRSPRSDHLRTPRLPGGARHGGR